MQDIDQFYVEVSNLTAFSVRHYSMINVCPLCLSSTQYLVTTFHIPMDAIYSIWSARDILKGQVEAIIQSMLPASTYSPFLLINQNRHERAGPNSFRHRPAGSLGSLPSLPGNEP